MLDQLALGEKNLLHRNPSRTKIWSFCCLSQLGHPLLLIPGIHVKALSLPTIGIRPGDAWKARETSNERKKKFLFTRKNSAASSSHWFSSNLLHGDIQTFVSSSIHGRSEEEEVPQHLVAWKEDQNQI